MGRTARIVVEIEDVGGSFARFIEQAPKLARRYLSTAVFLTADGVQREMEALAQLGPDGQGRTPDAHIKFDIEHRGRSGSLVAHVGIFDDADQVAVALYNEYGTPKMRRQPFMRPAAQAEANAFKARAIAALKQCERDLSRGVPTSAPTGGGTPKRPSGGGPARDPVTGRFIGR